jgi:hypothetical protein
VVTIKTGNTVACTVTLKAGKGSCTVPATKFGPGTVHVAAFYGGGISFQTSQSFTQTITVTKATSKTGLALSKSSVTFGHEQAEHLSVVVAPRFGGTPAGTVTIKAGGRERGVEPVVIVGWVQLIVGRLEVEAHPRS